MTDRQRYFTSRVYVAFFAFLALSGFALGALLTWAAPEAWVSWVMLGSGLVLSALTIVELRVPAFELDHDVLVIRIARLRKPIPIPIRELSPFLVQKDLLGLRLVRVDDAPWNVGHLGEFLVAGGRAILVSMRQLSRRDQAKLEEALRTMGRG